MSYLTYSEYQTWGGTLSEQDFERYGFKAEKLIDEETYGRISKLSSIPEEVKRLTYELITLGEKGDITAANVSSEQVGSWHKTYRNVSAASYTRASLSIIRTYLSGIFTPDGIPLLYKGVE